MNVATRVREFVRNEVGAGSIMSLALVATLVRVTGLVLPIAGFFVVHDRAQSASDTAALTAADVLNGVVTGEPHQPCAIVSDELATVHATALSCDVVGGDVYVSASLAYGPIRFVVTSRAGSPDG